MHTCERCGELRFKGVCLCLPFRVWFSCDQEEDGIEVFAYTDDGAAEKFVKDDFDDEPRDDIIGTLKYVTVLDNEGKKTKWEVCGEVDISWNVQEAKKK